MTSQSHNAPRGDASPAVVHVDVGLLDNLLGAVGEMALQRAVLSELGRRARTRHGFKELVLELAQVNEQLNRLSHDIQACVLNTRLVPVGRAFVRFEPMLAELSRAGEKQARLSLHGEATEVDRKIAEDLGEPLIHLVRNAFDHGIESAAERQAAGKTPEGTIDLVACHDGNQLVIEVVDDGRGLDLSAIRRIAVARGIRTEAEMSATDPDGVVELIFEPGFSTRDTVTSLSGRGVGMDAARRKVQSIGGTLTVESDPGRGTRARIRVPLTLAIIQALLVSIGFEVYAVPLDYVVETARVPRVQVRGLKDGALFAFRGESLPLLDTARVLGVEDAAPRDTERPSDSLFVVITEAGPRRIGLLVDQVIRRQEVVIKPLPKHLRGTSCVSGASVGVDGGIFLILNVLGMIQAGAEAAVR